MPTGSETPPRKKNLATQYIAQLSPAERIMREVSVQPDTGCWHWCGSRRASGYGQLTIARWSYLAHRVSYEAFAGPIPEGLTLDHLCRNPICVNPAHLEPVTQAVNNQRAAAVKTRCPRGHAYAGENLYVYQGRRNCRECKRQEKRRRRARDRTAT